MVMAQRVLYAEDEEIMRTLVSDQLKEEGYDVRTAADGEEAVEILGKESFDLILLDIKMPRRDGIDVLKFLREKNLRPRVVMLTGVEDVSIAISCVKLGAIDYVTKPFSLEALLECVRRVLAK
jgi:DNA-binding response OmpR family regulator